MRALAIATTLCVLISANVASAGNVKGHIRNDGRYVQPHSRANPDQFRYNNYSSSGNYNPYTGKKGTLRNEFSRPPQYNNTYNGGQGRELNQLYGNPSK